MWVPPEINQSNPKILLVGRDPGTQEMAAGRPFVGPAGQLLERLLASAGLRRAETAITNVVGTQPPGNTFQRHSKEDVARGLRELEALVTRLRPNLIVALGNEAAWATVEDWPSSGDIFSATGITERRGYVWDGKWGVKVLTALHPASILHADKAEKERGINAHIAKALLGLDLKKAAKEAKWAHIERPKRVVRFVTNEHEAGLAAIDILASPLVGCDIETGTPRETSCIGFAPSPSVAYVFTPPAIRDALALLENPRLKTVFHNGSFDLHFLWSRYNRDVLGYSEDTIVAFHAMWPEIAGKAEEGGGGKRTHKSLKFLASLYTNDAWWKCLASSTLVLMEDLKWKCIGDIQVGDSVVGFDENVPTEGKRRIVSARVVGKKIQTKMCVRVNTDKGSIVGTPCHRALVSDKGRRWHWRPFGELQPGWRLRYIEPWDTRSDYDAGWLSGLLDGEGTIRAHAEGNTGGALSLSQRRGLVLDRALLVSQDLGFDTRIHGLRRNVSTLYFAGGTRGMMRALGSLQPCRLLRNFQEKLLRPARMGMRTDTATVFSVEDAGEREVADIATTSHTFFAAGFGVHNSYSFASPEEEWTLNGRDCMVTLDCWGKMKPFLKSMDVEKIYRHEMSLIRPLAKISARGLAVKETLRQERAAALGTRAVVIEADLAWLAEPILTEARSVLSKPSLIWERHVCPCCRNGKDKRGACWSCAGLEKKPGKKAGVALSACQKCNGAGAWEEFNFNPNSSQQVAMLLYEALKLPPRHNEGKVTVDEAAVKSLLALVKT